MEEKRFRALGKQLIQVHRKRNGSACSRRVKAEVRAGRSSI